MSELKQIEQALANALRNGVPPQSPALDPLIARHRAWVGSMGDKPCTPEFYRGLADMYLAHPDFVARYETIQAGFAQYLATAMKAWANRQG